MYFKISIDVVNLKNFHLHFFIIKANLTSSFPARWENFLFTNRSASTYQRIKILRWPYTISSYRTYNRHDSWYRIPLSHSVIVILSFSYLLLWFYVKGNTKKVDKLLKTLKIDSWANPGCKRRERISYQLSCWMERSTCASPSNIDLECKQLKKRRP